MANTGTGTTGTTTGTATNLEANPFEDLINQGDPPNVGPAQYDPMAIPPSAEAGYFNIDDPEWDAHQWATKGINFRVPPIEPPAPSTCAERCADNDKERKKKCDAFRKRVAAAMKKAGCPSKVTAYATPKKTCGKKTTKATPKKKTTTAKRR